MAGLRNGRTSSIARAARTPRALKAVLQAGERDHRRGQEGDPDPEKNPRLRLAVKEAKSQSVPKDVIDRAIKKSQGGDAENYDEIRYEGYGPGGVAVIVEA